MTNTIEQMGLDLYNALRGPMSRMTIERMDSFKIPISGFNTIIIKECLKCAEINIKSMENMKRAGVKMDWEAIGHYNNLIVKACKNAINKEDKTMTMNTAFEVDNKIYEKNDKGNRFFVSDLANKICRKRISESAYEMAWEKYLQEKEDQAITDGWQDDMEADARKDLQDAKDREAEDTFNGKKEEIKKAAKPRRSKDVAFEMDTIEGHITLTAKQVDFIRHIPDTCFYENGLDSTPWCDVLADEIGGQFAGKPMTVGAMISTLREKNLIYVGQDHINGKKAKYFGFTVVGQVIAKKLGLQ